MHSIAAAYLRNSSIVLGFVCIDWIDPAARSTDYRRQSDSGGLQLAFYGLTVWNSLPSALHDNSLSVNRRCRHYVVTNTDDIHAHYSSLNTSAIELKL